MTEWLTAFDHVVDEAGTADAAECAVRDREYDAVLLSADFPDGDAGSLIAKIKLGRSGLRTAVVVVSKDLAVDDAIATQQRGAHDFLLEPLNPAELVTRVNAAVRTTALQSEILEQSRRLETYVYRDALTGLHNRRFLLVQLGALVSAARRHRRPITVVMIDLDHFKDINDTYGHDAGDRALVAVSTALSDRLRAEDYVGRLGGEEFLAILPDTGRAEGARVAEDLRRCAATEIIGPDGERICVTASVGWATWAGETPEQLVRRADRALYAAKAAGRDLVRQG